MSEEEAIKKLKQMISLNQFIIIHQPEDIKGNNQLNEEIKAMNFAINYIEKQKTEEENSKLWYESIIKRMAMDILACGGLDFIDIGKSDGNLSKDIQKIIMYYKSIANEPIYGNEKGDRKDG